MHKYKVRPGYGSDKLLIEFGMVGTDKQFASALHSVLKSNDVKAGKREDFIFLERANMTSPAGPFRLEGDEWHFVWIHAQDNQDAIHFMDRILQESGLFEKEEVDFNEYAQSSRR